MSLQFRSIICLLFLPAILQAQPSIVWSRTKQELSEKTSRLQHRKEWKIESLKYEGNRVTRDYILQREIPFGKGDWVPAVHLFDALQRGRTNLINTQLFLEVLPSLEQVNDSSVQVLFTVKERWYVFPIPYFKLADRNPNQWLFEQSASLERVNYGLKFNWENVSGRRDKLQFNYINGYSRQFLLYYEQPYADPKLQHGFLGGIVYSRNRQLAFATDANKQVFFPAGNNGIDGLITTSFRMEGGYSYRPGVKERHTFKIVYAHERIPDTVTHLIRNNAQKGFLPYFTGEKTQQRFGELSYQYQYFDVNNIAYPWKGFAFSGQFLQRGLGVAGMNLWQFKGKAGRYLELDKKTSLGLLGMGVLKLPFRQPLYNLQAVGYGDFFLRGLEYYVVDGVLAGIAKATLRRELLTFNVPTLILKSEKYKKIPFKIIGKLYGDVGGVHLPYLTNSILNNRLLYTWGMGVDVLSYYDFAARFEYSFNQLGEKGLFLHLRREF